MMITHKKNLGGLTAEHSPKLPTIFQIFTRVSKHNYNLQIGYQVHLSSYVTNHKCDNGDGCIYPHEF